MIHTQQFDVSEINYVDVLVFLQNFCYFKRGQCIEQKEEARYHNEHHDKTILQTTK